MTTPPDSLRAALDSVFQSSAYDWRADSAAASWLQAAWARLIAWINALELSNPWLFRIFVACLIGLLLIIVGHGLVLLIRTARGAHDGSDVSGAVAPLAPRDAAWFWLEADRLAAAGRFGDAMNAAFAGVAHSLDAGGLLQYHPAKTPAELLAEARLDDTDRARLRTLVRQLYSAVFGGGVVDGAEWAAWRQRARGAWNAPVT